MSGEKILNVGIIGAGNIGTKRLRAILEIGQDKISAVADKDQAKAKSLAAESGAVFYGTWQGLLADPNIDAVIVATTTDVNVKITKAALLAGKHVLAEKPLGSKAPQALEILKLVKLTNKILKVGFNHRHHPALWKAHQLFSQGKIGKILYIRCVYGHGARPGYDLEWRMQKKYSRGGELFDQGVHIIDLASWFLGKFTRAFGQTRNLYWKKSDLEDNAFCQLYTAKNQVADFHVSLTQWRNRFNFEVYGDKGYLLCHGLGKSYGPEKLVFGTSVGQGRVPVQEEFEFAEGDISWKEEWKHFRQAILNKRKPLANAWENFAVTAVLDALYKSARSNKIVKI